MGFLDELKRLARPYDEDEEELEEEFEQPAPPAEESAPRAEQRTFARPTPAAESVKAAPARAEAPARSPHVLDLRAGSSNQVVLIKPESFETAAEIADHLRDRRTVIMNLENAGKDVSRRLIDFLSGAAYAQDGKIRKAAPYTYIITPYSVELVGDSTPEEPESGSVYF